MVDKIKRLYVQKILPLVYDDSLSYYEVLLKLRDKINECIDEIEVYEQEVQDCIERTDALYDKVDTFDDRIDQNADDIDALETRMDTAERDIDSCENGIRTNSQNITSLTGRMGSAEGNISNLQGRTSSLETTANNLSGRVANNETAIGNLEDCCDEVGDDITALKGNVSGIKAKTDKYPASLGSRNQVLTVNNDASAAEWKNVPEELPSTSGNAGKFLAVNGSATGVEWANVAGGNLPAVSSGDAGKVLTVNQAETGVEWASVEGDGLPAIGGMDAGKVLTVNQTADGVEWKMIDESNAIFIELNPNNLFNPFDYLADLRDNTPIYLYMHREAGEETDPEPSMEDTYIIPAYYWENTEIVDANARRLSIFFYDPTGQIAVELDNTVSGPGPFVAIISRVSTASQSTSEASSIGRNVPLISTGDETKVLAVNSAGDDYEWKNNVIIRDGEVGVDTLSGGKTSIAPDSVSHSLGNVKRFELSSDGLEFHDATGNLKASYSPDVYRTDNIINVGTSWTLAGTITVEPGLYAVCARLAYSNVPPRGVAIVGNTVNSQYSQNLAINEDYTTHCGTAVRWLYCSAIVRIDGNDNWNIRMYAKSETPGNEECVLTAQKIG